MVQEKAALNIIHEYKKGPIRARDGCFFQVLGWNMAGIKGRLPIRGGILHSRLHGSFKPGMAVSGLAQLAKEPDIGELRLKRSTPFLMAPIGENGKHFAIYRKTEGGIIIAAIFHGRQNIEAIIHKIDSALVEEINKLEMALN